ncbi:hypothetical protein [uncultured Ruminococcus sp.]|uniref:hypothetical protein n=1 Tax=uncultured Ruminococcus sp. TaxID=165186 RepID=UPI002611D26E|nr:hypothetical protein [uncultured Ruminococcus sp.]
MKKYDNDMMNYDENGQYPDERPDAKQETADEQPAFIDKVMSKFYTAFLMLSIVLFIVFSRSNEAGYMIALVVGLDFVVFGITAMISEGVKKHKLSIPFLGVTICAILGMAGVCAYHNGTHDTRSFLIKLGIILFFMAFIVSGSAVIIHEYLSQRGNAKRCTFPVTATCIHAGTATSTVNGKTKCYCLPTYEYTYEGKTYRSKVSNVTQVRSEDMNYEIMIDPDHPKIAYDPDSEKSWFLSVIFGTLFVAMPIIALIVIFAFLDF